MSSEDAYTTDDQFDEKEQRHHGGGRLATATAINRNNKSTMKPRRWRPHEDHLLTAAVHQSGGTNWKAIASKVGSRNHVQCLQRWRKVLRPGLVKGQWSAEENALLLKLATASFKNWGTLSTNIAGRTSKQCRERWCHHLSPSINKGSYSREEDAIMLEFQGRLGNKWSLIAAELPGRAENSIKIRCKTLLRDGATPKPTPSASTRKSAGSSKKSIYFSFSSSFVANSSSSRGSGEGGLADQPPPPPPSCKGLMAPPIAPLAPPLRRPRLPSRGPEPEPPAAMFGGLPPPPPPVAPEHGGYLPSAGSTFASEKKNWRLESKLGLLPFRDQQQQQQQRAQSPAPLVIPFRNALVGDGVSGGDGVFNSRWTAGEYPGNPSQGSLPHIASDFNPWLAHASAPAAQGQLKEEKVYPDQRQAYQHADDELVTEALAAVSAADFSSPRSSTASLKDFDAVHAEAQDAGGQGGGEGDGEGDQGGDEGGGGGNRPGNGVSGGDGVFNSRWPAGEYPGNPSQSSLPHFATDFNPPLAHASAPAAQGQLKEAEVYPDQRQAYQHADDELVTEALAAVSAADLSSPRSSTASLKDFDAVHAEAQDASGQGGGGGDGEGDQGGDEGGGGGNWPLPSCCSFLALDAQDHRVGDMDTGQDEKDDDGGALMME